MTSLITHYLSSDDNGDDNDEEELDKKIIKHKSNEY